MKKVNLLSREEMKNVMGGIIDGATLYEVCIVENSGGRTYDGTTEDEILKVLIENHCRYFTIAIPF